jgi:hypothetical protein
MGVSVRTVLTTAEAESLFLTGLPTVAQLGLSAALTTAQLKLKTRATRRGDLRRFGSPLGVTVDRHASLPLPPGEG